MKTENEIMNDLVNWARLFAPADLVEFYKVTRAPGRTVEDFKAAARRLALCRIEIEPFFAYELPDSLIVKLGGEVDHVFDDRERSLATVIGARLERRIR